MLLLKLTLLLSLVPPLFAANVKTIKLCESDVAQVYISTRGTALEFPVEPEKVLSGSRGSFSIEYVRNDLNISPLSVNARSNLFVYLQGRRFVLDLVASPSTNYALYFIKDCREDRKSIGKK